MLTEIFFIHGSTINKKIKKKTFVKYPVGPMATNLCKNIKTVYK